MDWNEETLENSQEQLITKRHKRIHFFNFSSVYRVCGWYCDSTRVHPTWQKLPPPSWNQTVQNAATIIQGKSVVALSFQFTKSLCWVLSHFSLNLAPRAHTDAHVQTRTYVFVIPFQSTLTAISDLHLDWHKVSEALCSQLNIMSTNIKL